jgi:hypothetical protein
MMTFLRKNHKPIVAFLLLLFSNSILLPPMAKALTGGRSYPEANSIRPSGSSKMVNKFTGDFSYDIPLMKVGNYPVNLSYDANISMNQEASWVGLGWNLNPGMIKRHKRGLPDDFKGDKVVKKRNIKKKEKWNLKIQPSLELSGNDKSDKILSTVNPSVGLDYSSYKGFGISVGLGVNASIAGQNSSKKLVHRGGESYGANLSVSSNSGLNGYLGANLSSSLIAGSIGSKGWGGKLGISGGIGALYNSRENKVRRFLSSSTTAAVGAEKITGAAFGIETNASVLANKAGITHMPRSGFPWETTARTFSAKVGGELNFGYGSVHARGSYTKQALSRNKNTLPAYGYMYTQNGENSSRSLLDFNRRVNGQGGTSNPHLPPADFTNDLFSVSGQGVGGMYRLIRNDLGSLYKKETRSTSNSVDAGAEVGFGNLLKVGANAQVANSNTVQGKWPNQGGNQASRNLDFKKKSQSQKPYSFRRVGEKNVIDKSFYKDLQKEKPIRVKINSNIRNEAKYVGLSNNRSTGKSSIKNISRQDKRKSNQPMKVVKAKEAAEKALEEKIISYKRNKGYNKDGWIPRELSVDRVNDYAKKHHISSITVTKNNGKRYVYGLPTYVNKTKTASFSVGENEGNAKKGLVNYNTTDASTNNQKGFNNYYSSKETPAYASSYRLTAVLSKDYVDITDNGITEDDLGSYTKFNYTRWCKNYKWRSPFKQNSAGAYEMAEAVSKDNIGTYTYGEKELWYLHSIESRNKIAQFYTSERADGYGVQGESGGRGDTAMLKLDSIKLYNKSSLDERGDKAIPRKSVHFRYSYKLCPGVPNNDGSPSKSGKLTLKKVFYNYESSRKAELHPYTFDYQNPNPPYNSSAVDYWGKYQSIDQPSYNDKGKNGSTYKLGPTDRPYTQQNKQKVNEYSRAWKISSINLPSGASIKPYFESDRYGFVQNRRAMEMMEIVGTGEKKHPSDPPSANGKAKLYSNNEKNMYIYVKLNHAVDNYSELKQNYFAGKDQLTNLYINAFTKLKSNRWNQVPVYTSCENFGLVPNTNGKIAFLKLQKDNGQHPISRSAWYMFKNQFPNIFYKNEDKIAGIKSFFEQFTSILTSIKKTLSGFEDYCENQSYGQKIKTKNQSWVRLFSPDFTKYGGGHRVRKIEYHDNWSKMSSNKPQEHTKTRVFEYSMKSNPNLETSESRVSSGVATWEPIIGKAGNPHTQLVNRVKQGSNPLPPSKLSNKLKPTMSSFYPAPSIGYKRVRVISDPDNQTKRSGTGSTVYKFYTAKEFPTISRNTSKKHFNESPSFAKRFRVQLFGGNYAHKYVASEGFSIQKNDMHGKPKAISHYKQAPGSQPQSSTSSDKLLQKRTIYNYYTNDNITPSKIQPGYRAYDYKKVKNRIKTVNNRGSTDRQLVGLDVNVVNDSRYEKNKTKSHTVQANLDLSVAGIFPVPLITAYPKSVTTKRVYKSITTTKVIKRQGMVKNVKRINQGSEKKVEILLRDKNSGKAVLTKTKNKYEDPTFKFRYPAYWKYKGMGFSDNNIKQTFADVKIEDGFIKEGLKNPSDHFASGDQVLASVNGQKYRVWAHETKPGKNIRFINQNGYYVNFSKPGKLEVVKSGYDNLLNRSMGVIATKQNPLTNNGTLDFSSQSSVLSAKAKTFSDHWQSYADHRISSYCTGIDNQDDRQWLDAFQELLNKLNNNQKLFVDSTAAVKLDTGVYANPYQTVKNGMEGPAGCNPSNVYYRHPSSNPEVLRFNPGICECCQVATLSSRDGGAIFTDSIMEFENIRLEGVLTCKQVNQLIINAKVKDRKTNKVSSEVLEVNFGKVCRKVFGSECVKYCQPDFPDYINPYLSGIKGRWHKEKAFGYRVDRKFTLNSSNKTDIQKAGTYKYFKPFWYLSNKEWDGRQSNKRWIARSTTNLINPHNYTLETADATDRKSSALYGFNKQKRIAVAHNASYDDIAFNGFEDQAYMGHVNQCLTTDNWNFTSRGILPVRSHRASHTGKHGLYLPRGSGYLFHQQVRPKYWCNDDEGPRKLGYNPGKEDFIGKLHLDGGKAYTIEAWAKNSSTSDTFMTNEKGPNCKIVVSAIEAAESPANFDSVRKVIQPSGVLVDGWQKLEGTFTLNGTYDLVQVKLIETSNDPEIESGTLVDDIRIRPKKAKMKCFVYNPTTLEMVATLGKDNFATFFDYNHRGQVKRVMKETIEGIMTKTRSKQNKQQILFK